MDMEGIRQVLEDAAQTFLSAANTITNERRREAEKVSYICYFDFVVILGVSFDFRYFYNFVVHNFRLNYIVI